MVIKVYISGISASSEVKKRQQRVILLLDSFNVNYEAVDITEPGCEDMRAVIQPSFKNRGTDEKRIPLPPQFFNDDDYCGDYEDFNAAVDLDQLLVFLKIEEEIKATNGVNGVDSNQGTRGVVSLDNENELIEGEKIEEKNEALVDLIGTSEKDVRPIGEALLESEVAVVETQLSKEVTESGKDLESKEASDEANEKEDKLITKTNDTVEKEESKDLENKEIAIGVSNTLEIPKNIKEKDESEEEEEEEESEDEVEKSPQMNKDNILEKSTVSYQTQPVKAVEDKKVDLEEESEEEEEEEEEDDDDEDVKEKVLPEKQPENVPEPTQTAQVERKQESEEEEEETDEESED